MGSATSEPKASAPKVGREDKPLWSDLDDFTQGYVACAFWLADPRPGSGEYQFDTELWDGLDLTTQLTIIRDCLKFQLDNNHLLQVAYLTSFYNKRPNEYSPNECAGHDFYLSRNGHGTGFCDRGNEPIWQQLDDATDAFGESSLEYLPVDDCESHRETGECNDDCDHEGVYVLM